MNKLIIFTVVLLLTLSIVFGLQLLWYMFPNIHMYIKSGKHLANQIYVEKQNEIFLVHANVIPITQDTLLIDHTIVVRQGVIQEIRPTQKEDLSAEFVINADGAYVLPGLHDMHVHIADENDLLLFLANGITTVRNMSGFHVLGKHLHLELKHQIEQDKLIGPNINTCGNIYDGKPPIWPFAHIIENPGDAEALIKKEKLMGYDYIKIYSRLSEQVYEDILKSAQRLDMKVVGHLPNEVTVDHQLDVNLQYTSEHLIGYVDIYGRPQYNLKPDLYNEYAKRTALSRIWICPTLVVNQHWVPSEKVEQQWQQDELKYVSYYTLNYWKQYCHLNDRYIRKHKIHYPSEFTQNRLEMLHELHETGAKVVIGTDCNMPFVIPGFSIHEELSNFVKAGYSPYEVLYCATKAAAECLGNSGVSGCIKPGYRAELIIIEGNPLENISNLKRLQGVLLQDQWIMADQLKEWLRLLSRKKGTY